MHFCFCQISNKVINPEAGLKKTVSEEYYESLYENKEKDGYYRPEHFWELPLWIGEATHALSDYNDVSLHIVTDVNAPLPRPSNNTVYCFSVLDVNKEAIQKVMGRNHDLVYAIGGYINKRPFFLDLSAYVYSVTWYDSISDLCKAYGTSYKYGVNWKLFENYRTIPRLTMSYGCSNKCSFCTVSDKVTLVSNDDIHQQVASFIGLEFKLVYLNDLTFGQAMNADLIGHFYHVIKSYNPEFRGFIVQTACHEVNKRPAEFWSDNGIVVVELGIETYNDNLLSDFNKPQTEKSIARAVQKLSDVGIDTIANIVLGFPGENMGTYGKTLSFLHYFPFYALNVYTLALYANTELAGRIEPTLTNGITDNDKNELATTRTFWSTQEQRTFDHIAPLFYLMGIDKVKA